MLRTLARKTLTRFEKEFYSVGSNVECQICGWTGRRFLPGAKRANRKCARCGSVERYRQLWLYLRESTSFFEGGYRVLDFAPPPYFESAMREIQDIIYITADLMRPGVDVNTDISDLPFENGTFDFIICFHVLEHVRNDDAAMTELQRCLAPHGTAFLQVPIRGDVTFEDPTASPDQYAVLFGQKDHLRWYGLDIEDRLCDAGFDVEVVDVHDHFSKEVRRRYGLDGDDRYLFALRKTGRRTS